jgi:hypothetical protein
MHVFGCMLTGEEKLAIILCRCKILSLTMWKDRKLRFFENSVQRIVCGPHGEAQIKKIT